MRTGILVLRIVVQYARPDERSSLLWLHFEVQVCEHGLATLLDVGEVQEESQDARTTGEKLLASIKKIKEKEQVLEFSVITAYDPVKNAKI